MRLREPLPNYLVESIAPTKFYPQRSLIKSVPPPITSVCIVHNCIRTYSLSDSIVEYTSPYSPINLVQWIRLFFHSLSNSLLTSMDMSFALARSYDVRKLVILPLRSNSAMWMETQYCLKQSSTNRPSF